MKLSNKQYDLLKWVISIFLPALMLFMGVVFNTLGWEHSEAALTIAVAFEVFLGSIFKLSDHQYRKNNHREENIND